MIRQRILAWGLPALFLPVCAAGAVYKGKVLDPSGAPVIVTGPLIAEVHGDQPVVSGMKVVHSHRFPPSSERSLRTARKR